MERAVIGHCGLTVTSNGRTRQQVGLYRGLSEPVAPVVRSLVRSWSSSRCVDSSCSVSSSTSRCSLRFCAVARAVSSSPSSTFSFSCFSRAPALSACHTHTHVVTSTPGRGTCEVRDAENAGTEHAWPENAGSNVRAGKCRTGICRTKCQGRKMRDWKMQYQKMQLVVSFSCPVLHFQSIHPTRVPVVVRLVANCYIPSTYLLSLLIYWRNNNISHLVFKLVRPGSLLFYLHGQLFGFLLQTTIRLALILALPVSHTTKHLAPKRLWPPLPSMAIQRGHIKRWSMGYQFIRGISGGLWGVVNNTNIMNTLITTRKPIIIRF